jgi:TolC family type I secretion outer membrane protein
MLLINKESRRKSPILFLAGILLWPFLVTGQTYSLAECVRIALANKETVKSALLDVHSAQVGRRGAWSNILPSVRLSGGWNESRFPERAFTIDPVTGEPILDPSASITSLTTWSSGVGVSQNLYDGGAWWNRIAQARNDYRLSLQRERQTRIQVILDVHRAFFQLLKVQQLLTVARLNLDLTRQQVELVRRQFELGAVKKTDLLKAQVREGQARVDVINQERAVNDAQRTLRNAMGLVGTDVYFTIQDTDRPLMPLPEREEAWQLLQANNPGLLAAREQLHGAEINYKLARSLRLPNISANISYSASSEELSRFANELNESWRLNSNISLSLPLFSGFDVSSRIQQARYSWQKQRYEYRTLQHDLLVQLESQLELLQNYRDILPIDEEILKSAEEDLRLVQERYSLGSATILEVLDAQVSLTQARSNLVTTRYDARSQEAAFRAILGTLDREFE